VNEDRLQILKMVEEGKVSAQQGLRVPGPLTYVCGPRRVASPRTFPWGLAWLDGWSTYSMSLKGNAALKSGWTRRKRWIEWRKS